LGDEVSVKGEGGESSAIGCVGTAQPVENVKQFLDEVEGIPLGDGGGVVDGDVPHLVDGADFGKQSRFQVVLERLLVDEGSKRIIVGEFEVGVVRVEPVNGLF
jgi:hypothetical protein